VLRKRVTVADIAKAVQSQPTISNAGRTDWLWSNIRLAHGTDSENYSFLKLQDKLHLALQFTASNISNDNATAKTKSFWCSKESQSSGTRAQNSGQHERRGSWL